MSNAKITMFGFDGYFSSLGQSLFDNLVIPEGLTKDTLVDNIMLRGGDFEVMYGDPEFMRRAIGAWSLKWQPTFERWVKALAIEYNPLENYDRIEDWTDNTERSEALSGNQTHSRDLESSQVNSESGRYSQSDARHSDSDTDVVNDRDAFNNAPKHTVTRSAYDSAEYQPQVQETDTGKWKETTSGDSNESSATSSESKNSASSVNSETGSESTKNDQSSAMNNDSVHSGRIHGNIGVLTSQKMLMEELELGYWNIYEKITELFLQEFTIPVYI